MTAAEYLDGIKTAVRDREALARRIDAMGAPRYGSTLAGGGGSGAHGDPMARYDALMDLEPRLREQAARLDEVIREGREVIDGIGVLMGQTQALALELHYVGLHSWFEISIELHASMATCYRWRAAALDLLEGRGVARLREAGRHGRHLAK